MAKETSSMLTGVMIVTTLIIISGSISYYQFVHVPSSVPPPVPEEFLNPPTIVEIIISKGSSLSDNSEFFVPQDLVLTLGENNKVTWVNEDEVMHTATSEPSQSSEWNSNFILEGESWSFTFVKDGESSYQCTPHPWMKGSIKVNLPRVH